MAAIILIDKEHMYTYVGTTRISFYKSMHFVIISNIICLSIFVLKSIGQRIKEARKLLEIYTKNMLCLCN